MLVKQRWLQQTDICKI